MQSEVSKYLKFRKRIVESYVFPVLFNGMETWTLTEARRNAYKPLRCGFIVASSRLVG